MIDMKKMINHIVIIIVTKLKRSFDELGKKILNNKEKNSLFGPKSRLDTTYSGVDLLDF